MTYGSFDYTSLLYLSDYAEDFGGGRFVFMDAGSNKTIEPQAGKKLGLLPAFEVSQPVPLGSWLVQWDFVFCVSSNY